MNTHKYSHFYKYFKSTYFIFHYKNFYSDGQKWDKQQQKSQINKINIVICPKENKAGMDKRD